MQYLAHWPEYFQLTEAPGGEIMGYSKSYKNFTSINFIMILYKFILTVMGKAEGPGSNWHGHVTALRYNYIIFKLIKIVNYYSQISVFHQTTGGLV